MNNSANVSVGKPKTGGAIYRAPLGTTLPTDAISALDAAFKGLGYCSDDGLTNNNSAETENIVAWGGDTVLTVQTSKEDTFNYTLIESLNTDVLKATYGDANVSGDINTGIKIVANSAEQELCSMVIDMILRGGVLKRIVIPRAKVTNVDEISYVDNEAIGYNTTLSCFPDDTADEATHYEYIQKPGAVTYSVTQNLTNVTSDFSGESVADGAALTINLTAETGYEIDTVTVLMGGEDITATAYSAGVVIIDSVTEDVVITAVGSEGP